MVEFSYTLLGAGQQREPSSSSSSPRPYGLPGLSKERLETLNKYKSKLYKILNTRITKIAAAFITIILLITMICGLWKEPIHDYIKKKGFDKFMVYNKQRHGSRLAYEKLYTDHIYVMTMPHQTIRRARLKSMFDHLGLDAEFVRGVNFFKESQNYNLTEKVLRKYNVNVVGCWLSHLRIWQDMVKKGYESALIFEDDIDFQFDTPSIIRKAMSVADSLRPEDWQREGDVKLPVPLPENRTSHLAYDPNAPADSSPIRGDWEAMFLGHCGGDEKLPDLVDKDFSYLHQSRYPLCLAGYILRRSAVKKLVEWYSDMIYLPIDMHVAGDAQNRRIKALSFYPAIVTQRRDLTKEGSPSGFFTSPLNSVLNFITKHASVYTNEDVLKMGL